MQTLAIIFFILFCLVSLFGHIYRLVDFSNKSREDIKQSLVMIYRTAKKLHVAGVIPDEALEAISDECRLIVIETKHMFLTYEKVARFKKEVSVLSELLDSYIS